MMLRSNPFFILKASTRDTRARIIQLAEECALIMDPQAATMAKADLINPRQRLMAEVSWLVGIGPARATAVAQGAVEHGPPGESDLKAMPPLAAANALLAGLECLDFQGRRPSADAMASALVRLADLVEDVDANEVYLGVNEDRSVAGFPATEIDRVEAALDQWRSGVGVAVANLARGFTSDQRILILTKAISEGTSNGDEHGPALLHDLVDSISVDLYPLFDDEGGGR